MKSGATIIEISSLISQKKWSTLLIFFFSLLISQDGWGQAGQCLTGGCSGGTSYGSVQSTSSLTFVASVSNTYAGEYNTYNVTSGVEYEWSLVPADGATNPTSDAQLTLLSSSGSTICYSDDAVGTHPKIKWLATSTTTVRVLINDYTSTSCNTNSSSHRVVWRVSCINPTLAATTAASSIGCTSATSGGNVTADGGCSVTERGICYNTLTTPTTSNSKVISGTGTGSFSANLTGLSPGQTYYVRSYAITFAGTSYGAEISFTTLSAPATPSTISPTTVCANNATIFTSSATGNPTSYSWTLPGGWTGTSNTSSITVTPNTTSGSISVTASNACGTSAARNTSITVTNLTAPTITNITNP